MSHDGHEHEHEHDHDHDHDHGADHEHTSEYATERKTAPQTPYTTRDVGVGAAVALVGMLVVFAVPLVLA